MLGNGSEYMARGFERFSALLEFKPWFPQGVAD
jgi:hypothetical protein